MPDERSSGAARTLGDRLNRLVATVHPPERGPYTDEEVVDGIRSVGGPSLSAQYFNHLRHGRRDNPTKAAVEGIARFFRVPVGYLFADEFSETDDADRHILTVVRRANLEDLVELLGELPRETKDSVVRIVEDLHRMHSSGHRPRRG
ncbi:ESX-1 secreted protein regulator EspR [Pseudonocardia sp. Ae717_Ps2]|nr:ESX-1 secreted protein regulator EspR [Pseudonocardia sp. Ae717_Ps2]